MAMVDELAQCHHHHLPSLAREGTAMRLILPRPIPQARDIARGPENGATTETFDDDVGKTVRKSVGDTAALADTAAETEAVRVWIRAELLRKGAR